MSHTGDASEGLEGLGRLRDLALEPALRPIAPHLASLRRRLAALAQRLPPDAAPPAEPLLPPGE